MVRSAAVRARLVKGCAAAAIILAGAAGLPAASLGVDPAERADQLRQAGTDLAAKERSAAIELYALESRLARTRAEAAALEQQAAAAGRSLRAARLQLAAARDTLRATERFLGARLRILYEQGQTDPVAVILGAESLEAALDSLDSLHFAAEQDRQIIQRTLEARRSLAQLARTLDRRQAGLLLLRDRANARAEALVRASAERRSYIAELAAERSLNVSKLAELQAQAQAARERAERIAAPTAIVHTTPMQVPAPPAEDGTTMTVVATGYALPGRTATGLTVGWGVVAVDPNVIPLGTRMTIPGYGEGVAADIGAAVRGPTIDLWFPTRAQALAWGTRTVTITIH
jgi:3D (Asp-Asp-Asp) domain-containing protein/septal ring factor EnvC (AmiA/AmiB activator)